MGEVCVRHNDMPGGVYPGLGIEVVVAEGAEVISDA